MDAFDPVDLPRTRRSPVARRQEGGTGPAVNDAFHDGVRWTVIGGVLGAVIALPLAFAVLPELTLVVRLLVVAAAGALGGSVVGFTMAAGRSDDDADNGLGAEDARAEEAGGFLDGTRRTPAAPPWA